VKRRRVVAYVTRVRDGQTELLVFEDPKHPHTGTQVPAGRLDPDEELEAGLLREIAEETGLEDVRIVRELAGFEEHYPSRYENHGFQLVVESHAPDEWEHVVYGRGDDAGLVFRFRWVPIGTELQLFRRAHPFLERLAEPVDDA
jgi:8-oxo-dGTP pyrophosphatase MutT (NUDIX family)